MSKRDGTKLVHIQTSVPESWIPLIHDPAIAHRDGYVASARIRQLIASGLAQEAAKTGSGFTYEGWTAPAPPLLAAPTPAGAAPVSALRGLDLLALPADVLPVPADAPRAPVAPILKDLPPDQGGGGRGPGGLL